MSVGLKVQCSLRGRESSNTDHRLTAPNEGILENQQPKRLYVKASLLLRTSPCSLNHWCSCSNPKNNEDHIAINLAHFGRKNESTAKPEQTQKPYNKKKKKKKNAQPEKGMCGTYLP